MKVMTTCTRDCPDACGIVADVDVAETRVVKLAGDPDHPVTRGFLCWRTNHFLDLQYDPWDQRDVSSKRRASSAYSPLGASSRYFESAV